MTRRVVFRASAENDLTAIDDYISLDNPDRALAFVRRIRTRCSDLSDFPFAGALREEFGEAVRLIGFERRVSILYRVTADEVIIARVFYGGREIVRVD